jgi:hypothetical protein
MRAHAAVLPRFVAAHPWCLAASGKRVISSAHESPRPVAEKKTNMPGETFMDMSLKRQAAADTSALESSSNELIKLICKLRWIGMDDEAQRLSQELTRRSTAADDSVVANSAETD